MNRIVKNALLMLLMLGAFAFTNPTANAQQIAYVDAEEILDAMPDFKRVESELAAYKKVLERQLQAEEEKMKKYYQDVMKKIEAGLLSPAQQKEEEAKLMKMQEDLQKKALEADKSLATKEGELTKPLYEKFNNALKGVAKSNNFNYILDKKLLLYHEGGVDATAKVKAALGLP